MTENPLRDNGPEYDAVVVSDETWALLMKEVKLRGIKPRTENGWKIWRLAWMGDKN